MMGDNVIKRKSDREERETKSEVDGGKKIMEGRAEGKGCVGEQR